MNAARWLLLTVAVLPLLVPRGPGNTAPVDVFAVGLILCVATAVLLRRRRLPIPGAAALSAFLLVTLASLVANPGGDALLTVTVELYLIVLFVAAYALLHGDERMLRRVLVVWTVAALLWAVIQIATFNGWLPSGLQNLIEEQSTSNRPSAAARNPNLAASYLTTSLFVLWASPWPRRLLTRAAATGVLGYAIVTSGSNGALLAIAAGAGYLLVTSLVRYAPEHQRPAVLGGAAVTAAVLVGAVLATTGVPQVSSSDVSQVARESRGSTFEDSLGRLDRSIESREQLWSTAWEFTSEHPVIGLGPGQAKETRTADGEELGKSLHNDYLAFLIERGILGLAALLWLVAAVWGSCRVLAASRARGVGRTLWRPSALAAAVVANLTFALTHESFHFRHVWVLLALVVAARVLVEAPERVPRTTTVATVLDVHRPREVAHDRR